MGPFHLVGLKKDFPLPQKSHFGNIIEYIFLNMSEVSILIQIETNAIFEIFDSEQVLWKRS